MTPTVNGHRGPSRTAAATAVRKRQGAHNAALVLAARVRELSDEDLLSLADVLVDEVEHRGLPFWDDDEGRQLTGS